MLDEKEIKMIIEGIEQKKSNYRISKERHHSPNTIGKIREKYEKTKKKQKQGEDLHYTNPIDKIRGIIADLDTIIQTAQLDDRNRKEWEKRLEELKEILRVEVDDRIPKERTDTIKERDQEWNKVIQQNYVKKEVATKLEGTIQESNTTIQGLTETIGNKDDELRTYQSDIFTLKYIIRQREDQIQSLFSENKALNDKNYELHDYIKNRLDDEVRQCQEQLRHKQEVFNVEKTYFATYKEEQRTNLNTLFFEAEEKRKAVEMREKQLDEREEKQQKRENEFDATKNRWYNECSEIVTALKTRVEEIAKVYCEKLVKRWIDKQSNEIR